MISRCLFLTILCVVVGCTWELSTGNGVWVQVDGVDDPRCGVSTFPCKTIQFALDKIGTGNISDNIVILNPGEYNGTGNVNLFVKCRGTCQDPLSQQVTIMGSTGNYRDVIINGNNLDRILSEGTVKELVLEGITFSNGMSRDNGGCIQISRSLFRKLTINNSFFWNCSADGYGGAIFVESVAKLDIDHSVFIHNHAQKGGGIIASSSLTKVTIQLSEFMDSSTEGKGGVGLLDGQVYIQNSTFFANVAQEEGGALYLNNHQGVISYSDFFQNFAQTGGGVYVNSSVMSVFQGNQFRKNHAEQNGGGLFVDGNLKDVSFLYIHSSDFVRNEATQYGGGVFLHNIDATLQDSGANIFHSNFQENTALIGGGLYLSNSGASLLGSYFRHNYSPDNQTIFEDRNLYCDQQSKEIDQSCFLCCGAKSCTQCQTVGACVDETNGNLQTTRCYTSGTIGVCPDIWLKCNPPSPGSTTSDTPSTVPPAKNPSHSPILSPTYSPVFFGNLSNNSTHLPIDRIPGILIGLIVIVAIIAIVVVGIVGYVLWRRKRENEFELI